MNIPASEESDPIDDIRDFLDQAKAGLIDGSLDLDELTRFFDEEVANPREPKGTGLVQYLFGMWLLVQAQDPPRALHQLRLGAQTLAAYDVSPEREVILSAILLEQAKCYATLADSTGAFRALDEAVDLLYGVIVRADAAPVFDTPLKRAQDARESLVAEDVQFAMGRVCARYASLLLSMHSVTRSVVIEASHWMLLALKYLEDLGRTKDSVVLYLDCAVLIPLLGVAVEKEGIKEDELQHLIDAPNLFDEEWEEYRNAMEADIVANTSTLNFLSSLMNGNWKIEDREDLLWTVANRSVDEDRPLEFALSTLLLAVVSVRKGEAEAAGELFDTSGRALEVLLAPGHPWRALARVYRAAYHLDIRDRQRALVHTMLAAAETTLQGGAIRLNIPLLAFLARLYAETHLAASLLFAKVCISTLIEIWSEVRQVTELGAEAYAPTEEVSEQVAGWLITTGRLGEAMQVLSVWESTSVIHIMEQHDRGGQLDRRSLIPELSFTRLEQQLAGRINELSEHPCTDLEQERARLSAAFQEIITILEQEEEHHAEQISNLEELLTDRLADELPSFTGPTASIRYLVQSEHTDILVLTVDGILHTKVEILSSELARLAFDFLRQLSDPESTEYLHAAQTLYDLLFPEPVIAKLTAEGIVRLLIAPAGPARFISFAALHDGEQYLVNRFSVVLRPEVRMDLKVPPGYVDRVALLGASFEGTAASLPMVQAELNTVRRLLEGGLWTHRIVLEQRNRSFGRDALRKALSGAYRIVHVASHFGANPAESADSILLLGDGSGVRLSELAELAGDLHEVEMLVLSACATGQPTARSHQREWTSPAGLFHARGVRSVVATLWPVADASMSLLIGRFYRAMLDGADKGDALRRAQQSLLHGDSREDFSHPYHWAAPTLSGNWLPFRLTPGARS